MNAKELKAYLKTLADSEREMMEKGKTLAAECDAKNPGTKSMYLKGWYEGQLSNLIRQIENLSK